MMFNVVVATEREWGVMGMGRLCLDIWILNLLQNLSVCKQFSGGENSPT
jgi:hypothetical protein